MKSIISLTKYEKSPDSLGNAISLCEGFSNLKPSGRVMIKPNLVTWDDKNKIAPFGVFTTTRIIEDLVILLRDFGCTDISIGEGSVEIAKGVGTMAAFEGLGYGILAKRYGVKLVDFNESKSEKFAFHEENELLIATEAIESDFFINVPVMKTHGQTKVSLGMKNLKGCLKTASKKLCHHPGLGLEYSFSFIADFLKPSLTIVDGIFALERGAFHFGNAYRKNILVASKDILGADLAAAKTIGYDGASIGHFAFYAKRNGGSLDLAGYEIKGENLLDHVHPLKWDWDWTGDNTGPGIFKKYGVTGAALPKYDETLCSGCSPFANMCNILVLSAFKGQPLPKVEILNGKKMKARPGFDATIMLGNCIIKTNKNNPDVREAIEVKGCPPNYEEVVSSLKKAGLDVREPAYAGYLKQQGEKYQGKPEYDPAFFTSS